MKSARNALLGLVTLLARCSPFVSGVIISDTVNTADCFAYVDRFAFASNFESDETNASYSGYFAMNVSYPTNMTNLAWLVFFNSDNSWGEIVDDELSCKGKHDVAIRNGNVFEFRPEKERRFLSGESYTFSSTMLRFSNRYVRMFYLAIINIDPDCETGCDAPLFNISYTAQFLQRETDESGNPFENQAPFDETSLLAVYVVLGLLSIFLVVWSSVIAHKLLADDKLHQVYKLLMLSIQCGAVGILCQLIHRVILQTGIHYDTELDEVLPIKALELKTEEDGYPNLYDTMNQMLPPGKGVSWLDQDSQYFFLIGEWVLLVHCMLVAKGWTIVRRKLPAQGRFRLSLGMSVYLYLSILLTAWLFNTYDPQREMWFFNARGCVTTFFLKLILFIWFIISANHTKNKFLRKRRFFNKYQVVVGLWIIVVPIVQMVVELSAAFYATRQTYAAIQGFSLVGIWLAHLVIYNPDQKCNKGFPFHADVTHMNTLNNKTSTTVTVEGLSAEGEVVEKIVRLEQEDFAHLEQYSLRIQERLARLSEAMEACQGEYDDISFVKEDEMTALDLQTEKDSLFEDLTHGLRRTPPSQSTSMHSKAPDSPEQSRQAEKHPAEDWGAVPNQPTLVLHKKRDGTENTTATKDLISGAVVTSRQRADAIDAAVPQQRSDLRKMKRAAGEKLSRRKVVDEGASESEGTTGSGSGKHHQDVGGADSAKRAAIEDDDEDGDVILRRSPKKHGKREKREKKKKRHRKAAATSSSVVVAPRSSDDDASHQDQEEVHATSLSVVEDGDIEEEVLDDNLSAPASSSQQRHKEKSRQPSKAQTEHNDEEPGPEAAQKSRRKKKDKKKKKKKKARVVDDDDE